jgi:hypothetical protein
MAERKQVARLQRDTIVRPTAQVVDTYVRPQQEQVDPTAEILAQSLSKLVPGISTKAGQEEKKRQQALGEKEFMREQAAGYKVTRDNIMAGNEYIQDSPIALKHLQVLRAQNFVENNLSEFSRDLFAGSLTDENGQPLQIGSREELNQRLYGKVNEISSVVGPDDEFIITAIAPKVKEWQHNTLVKWEAQEHKKLLAERENLYALNLANIFKNREGKSTAMVIQELTTAVDSHYALGSSKATETFVDQMVALADANNDMSIIDTALAVKPGGRGLTPTQLEKLIEGREKIENEIEAEVAHQTKVEAARRKRDKEAAMDQGFDWIMANGGADANLNDPEYLQIMSTYSDNGGNAASLIASHRTMVEKAYTTVTPSNTRALDSAKMFLTSMAQDPSRRMSMEGYVRDIIARGNMEGPLRPGMEFVRSIHPTHLAELRTYAKGLENANNFLSDPDVNKARASFIGQAIGTKGSFGDIGTEFNQQKAAKEQEYDALLSRRLTEAYIESGGTLGTAQVRQIAQNTAKELLDEQAANNPQDALLDQAIKGAAKQSLRAWNNSDNGPLFFDDNIDQLIVPEQFEGMTTDQLDELRNLFDQVISDPTATKDVNGQPMQAWQRFDQVYWPGAFAYYARFFKKTYFD